MAWSRNRWDPGTCTGKMECGLPAYGGGRPRGQKSQTHQYVAACEVGPPIDASSIGHGHPGFDGQLRESARLGPAIRAPAGWVSVLQGPETGFFPGPGDVPSKARGWGVLQILEWRLVRLGTFAGRFPSAFWPLRRPRGHGATGVVQCVVPISPWCHVRTAARGSSQDADDAGPPSACWGVAGRMGVEGIQILRPRGLQIAFTHRAYRGPGRGASVPFALEASNSAEDEDIRMASHPGPPDDAIHAAALCAGSRRRLRHVLQRNWRLHSPIFWVSTGPARVDCNGFGRNQRHVCGCFLALDLSRAFPAGGRVEDHFRHFMGDMAPPERDHLQGSSPLHRHGTAWCEVDCTILASRWYTPCCNWPILSVISSITTGGHCFWAALYLSSKKKKKNKRPSSTFGHHGISHEITPAQKIGCIIPWFMA